MNQRERNVLQDAIRGAAKKASRNPPPGHDLYAELTAAGMAYLDEQSERIHDALADGESVYSLSRGLWRDALLHLLQYRKSARPAKAA